MGKLGIEHVLPVTGAGYPVFHDFLRGPLNVGGIVAGGEPNILTHHEYPVAILVRYPCSEVHPHREWYGQKTGAPACHC